jgi:hypothetical protein
MSELEQTIEELEAEVLAELEEAENPAKKGAAPAEKADKVDGKTPGGEVEDLGGDTADEADPQKKNAVGKKASDEGDEASGDPAQKGEGKPDAPKKLAAGDEVEHAGKELKENKKATKAQHLENIAKMKKADIEEMIAAHASKLEETENAETEEALQKLESAKAEIEDKIKNISVKEDVEALVNADDSLSEEFKVKAATIFEAAVKSRVRSEIERIDDELNTEKDVAIESIKEELSEKVDTYLNYVVEEWTKENELAIERGLKGEIAEDFISGLKQLFEDHYIDVPDEKYDVLEAQSEKISELEGRLNEEMQKNIDLSTDKSELVREQVISEVSEDLADTEIEKFKSLTEDLAFADEESFRDKLNTLKDNYFPKTVVDQSLDDEDGSTAQDTVDTTDAMKTYMSAISRNHKASA